MKIRSKMMLGGLATMMVSSLLMFGVFSTDAYASTKVAWTPPTTATSITFQQDGKTFRYVSGVMTGYNEEALEFMGVNCTTINYQKNQGMNLTDPTSNVYYAYNNELGVYGSDANSNPDPYIRNLFYNYYIDANSMSADLKSTDVADDTQSGWYWTEINDAYGTENCLKFRPDIVYTQGADQVDELTDGLTRINAFATDSEYYKAKSETYVGDTNYDPIIAYNGGWGMSNIVQNMYNVAQAVTDAVNLETSEGVNVTTRYANTVDPLSTAVKYEEFIRATEYYIQSKIADGTVKEKTVLYVYDVDDDGNITAYDPPSADNMDGTYYQDTCFGSTGVVKSLIAGQGDASGYAPVSIDDVAKADAIVFCRPDNWGSSRGIGRDDRYAAETKATTIRNKLSTAGYANANTIPIYTTNGNLVIGTGQQSLCGTVQVFAWTNAFLYPEILNSVDMTAYFYETFYHLKFDALKNALALNLGDTLTMPEGQSLDDLNTYQASSIEDKFQEGMAYYMANESSIVAANPELKASDNLKRAYEDENKAAIRLAGTTRFETMQKIVAQGFSSADTVVVTSSNSFADALSSAGLAGSASAPILFTDSASLTQATQDTITGLGAKQAIIVGGEAAVSANVANQLTALGLTVTRVSGASRQATAVAVAGKLTSDTAIIATGSNFADALSISPYAYSASVPMYLAKDDGSLDDETINAIAAAGYSKIIIVSGTAAVSADVESALGALTGAQITRIAGANRYDTSNLIASYLISNRLAVADGMAAATGANFPDALAGAALCGRNHSVILLVSDSNPTCINGTIATNKANIHAAYIFGGTSSVSEATESLINTALQV